MIDFIVNSIRSILSPMPFRYRELLGAEVIMLLKLGKKK